MKLDFGDYTCGGNYYDYTYVDRKSEQDLKGTLSRVKDVTKCPFSGRKGTKQLTIGFCCKNCLKKGKNQGN